MAKLKKAAFFSLNECGGDKAVFQEALDKMDDGGHLAVRRHKKELVDDFDQIKLMRKEWIEKKAIPELEAAIKNHPPTSQTLPMAEVELPEELSITRDSSAKFTTIVSNLNALQKELEWYK